jgi:phage tail sheath protein FI
VLSCAGAIAGLYARTDATRGVWSAPAGSEASLSGPASLELTLTDLESEAINVRGLNALRLFSGQGVVVWGARTLLGSDRAASEWKYVPVRRTALFIEASVDRGTQWVVFEPNGEPLWAQIRLSVSAFLQELFGQGAFRGASPAEAYFVKCDAQTTTQADIDLGVVNMLVGFAPLKPAEFVVLRISRRAQARDARR